MEKINDPIQSERERLLWKQAKRRVDFRSHLATYIIINGFLWGIWFFSGERKTDDEFMPWPVWTTLGWGIGLAFDAYNTYFGNRVEQIEREYEKLKNRN